MKKSEILENIVSGLIIITKELNVLYINKTACQILDIEDKKNSLDELKSPRLENLLRIIKEAIENNKFFDREEIEIRNKKNNELTIGLTINKIKNVYLIVFRDITEIKEITKENEIRKRLIMLGQMAAGVAHEIRNPLSSIRGLIELSKAKIKDKKIKKNLEIALLEIDAINNIITDVLNFAKPWHIETNIINFNEYIDELIVKNIEIKKNEDVQYLKIIKEYDNNIGEVKIDSNAVKIIFNNIFINAIEAIEDKKEGEIKVITKLNGTNIELTVIDNGIGIEEDKKELLLNPFYSTKPSKGTGLGLTITKKIIDTIKGKLYFENNKNSKGMLFKVVLPIYEIKEGDNN
ncbi:MAG TPA: ATP-binding protein [bacterium]|nr:ATP-binding protein [bacterium]